MHYFPKLQCGETQQSWEGERTHKNSHINTDTRTLSTELATGQTTLGHLRLEASLDQMADT